MAGELPHLYISRLGRIVGGPGHCVTGDRRGLREGSGRECAHACGVAGVGKCASGRMFRPTRHVGHAGPSSAGGYGSPGSKRAQASAVIFLRSR